MEKINKLKKLLNFYNLDGYIIPKNDEFFGEYIPKNKDRLKFISNFSGSFGFALILKDKNYLFVDGRYTLQAKIQSGKFFKILTIPNKFPKDVFKFKSRFTLGFDPKLHTENQINFLFKIKNLVLKPIDLNLVDLIWQKKPKEKVKKFFYLSNKNAGRSSHKKILELKRTLVKNKSDFLFISAILMLRYSIIVAPLSPLGRFNKSLITLGEILVSPTVAPSSTTNSPISNDIF